MSYHWFLLLLLPSVEDVRIMQKCFFFYLLISENEGEKRGGVFHAMKIAIADDTIYICSSTRKYVRVGSMYTQ